MPLHEFFKKKKKKKKQENIHGAGGKHKAPKVHYAIGQMYFDENNEYREFTRDDAQRRDAAEKRDRPKSKR